MLWTSLHFEHSNIHLLKKKSWVIYNVYYYIWCQGGKKPTQPSWNDWPLCLSWILVCREIHVILGNVLYVMDFTVWKDTCYTEVHLSWISLVERCYIGEHLSWVSLCREHVLLRYGCRGFHCVENMFYWRYACHGLHCVERYMLYWGMFVMDFTGTLL